MVRGIVPLLPLDAGEGVNFSGFIPISRRSINPALIRLK
jgi:hypothetical protein